MSTKSNFNKEFYEQIFKNKIVKNNSKGIDKKSFKSYPTKNERELLFNSIDSKINTKKYRFSPYLELLRVKKRNTTPRMISIPTVKDKIVLSTVKSTLHDLFPENINKNQPNSFIKKIKDFLSQNENKEIYYLKADISHFYDNIGWAILKKKLLLKVENKYTLKLIMEGKPFYLGIAGKDQVGGDILMFKIYDIVFDKITGIAINKEQQTASIRFSLKANNITPFGRALRNDLDNLFKGELNFKKFDTGWQLESDQNKSAAELVGQITKEGQGVTSQNVPDERERAAKENEQANDQSFAERRKMAEDEAKRKMDSLFYAASQSMTNVVDQVDNASNETNFNDIQSFFNFFKQAIVDNDKEKLYKYLDHSSFWTKSKFMKEYQFSSLVRKLIIKTSLPVYSNENQSYSIQGNDSETGEAMLFSIVFKKSKKGDWTWDMLYFS